MLTPRAPPPSLRPRFVGPEVVYLNGSIVPAAEAKISVFDRGFLFGDAVYELVRTFDRVPLAMHAHVARLGASLRSILLGAFDPEEFRTIVNALLDATDLRDANIYLQISRGASASRQHVPDESTVPTVLGIATPAPSLAALTKPEKATAVTAEDQRWLRCDIKAITLLPNVLAVMNAHEHGASEAILLRNGLVSEGTHSNVLTVIEGALVTPPIDGDPSILHGTMRKLAIDAARDLGILIEERPITLAELLAADEIALTSSRKIMHVLTKLDGAAVGTGGGMIFERIFTRMRDSIQQVIDNIGNALPAAR